MDKTIGKHVLFLTECKDYEWCIKSTKFEKEVQPFRCKHNC